MPPLPLRFPGTLSFSAQNCLTLLLALSTLTAFADDRVYNTSGTLDWVMVEERRPYFQGSNWSPFQGNGYPVVSTEGAWVDFYAGFGDLGSAGSGFSHFSTWPIVNPIHPDDGVKIAYLGTTETGHDTDGAEGTSAGSTGAPPFGILTNVWYRFAIRCWQPADGTPHVGYVGQWQREETSGVWYHKVTFKMPFTATGVTGLGGFIEGIFPYDGARQLNFRNAYAHQFGQPATTIQKANQCSVFMNPSPGGYAGLSPDGSYVIASSMYNVTADPLGTSYPVNCAGNTVTITLANQPATPPFDPIVVTSRGATAFGSQLLVHWASPATSSPQLGYRIEVFNDASYSGAPALTFVEREPEIRQKLLNIPSIATPYVRLTITDIFDRTSDPILITPVAATLNPPTEVTGAVSGLSYNYYQAGNGVVWSNLPVFSALTPVLQGAVGNVDTSLRTRRSQYAFNYTGFIQVPANGLYAFTLTSYDSSKLLVDGVEVVNFDGLHQRADKSGWIALAAGQHAVSVQYAFSDQRGQTTYWDDIWVAYEGPGISKQWVPANAWYRLPGSGEPTVSLATPANSGTVCGSNITLTAAVTLNGATANRIQYYVGNYSLGQSATSPYSITALYGAAATNRLRARLFYNDGYSVDSVPDSLVATTNMDVSPWTLTPLQFHNYPTGARVQAGEVTLTGDYLNLMTRQVTGDFTFIARLAAMTPNVPSTDGRLPEGAWRAGVIVRGTTNLTMGQPLGDGTVTRSTELFSSVGGGTHYEDDTMRDANGDANRWSADLGGAHRWYKIVRAGDTFYSSISADGANWKQVWSNTLTNIGPAPHVGLFTYAVQSANPHRHWATFDSISLVGNGVGAPEVTVSPATVRTGAGQTVILSAGVVGRAPFAFQWQHNGANIVGATNSTLTLSGVQLSDSGTYTVTLLAGNGSADSGPSALTVAEPWIWDARPALSSVQDGSGIWSGTATNWWAGAGDVAWQDGYPAAFGVNTTTNCTVTLTNDVTPLSLAFNATGGGSYTLAGANTIWANDAPLPILCNADATISGILNGSGGVAKSGSGKLTFSGDDSYAGSGGLFINGGTLVLNTPHFNTFHGGGVFINNGSTFRVTQTGGATRYDFPGTPFTFDANGGGTIDTSSGVNFVIRGECAFNTRGGAQDLIIGSSGLNLGGHPIVFDVTRGTGVSDLKVATHLWNAGFLTKTGTGILELSATNTYPGATTVEAGMLWVNGEIAAGELTVNTDGSLGGTGVIAGPTTIRAGGTLSPGTTGIGTLTINNSLSLSGVTRTRLNASAATADKVRGLSSLVCGGTLSVVNLDGVLAAGHTFTLFSAATYQGTFDNIILPALNDGLTWNTASLAVNGTLSVVAFTGANPPADAPLNLTASIASGRQINLSWSPVNGATAYVLSRDGTPLASVSGTSYADTDFTPGATSCYTVTAVNFGGSSAASPSACANATLTWDANLGPGGAQDGNGIWDTTSAHWFVGSSNFIWAEHSAASFCVSTGTNCTVTIAQDVTPACLTFNESGKGQYTLAGGGGGIILSGPTVITVSNAGAIATRNSAGVSAELKGAGSLIKAGRGTLALTGGNNTYTGGTIIKEGTLYVNQANENFGSSTFQGAVTVDPGATLIMSNNPAGWGGGLTTLNVNGGIVTGNGGIGAFGVIYNLTSGQITGAARMDLGTYNFVDGAIHSLASSATSIINPGQGLMLRGDSGQTNYVIAVEAGSTANKVDLQIIGAIAENGAACSLTKAGPGTLVLTGGNNTYTGGTIINDGILYVNQDNEGFNSSAFRGTVTVNPGATLTMLNNPAGWGGGLTALNVNGGTVTGNGGLGAFGVIYNLTGGHITGTSRIDLGSYNSVNGAIRSLASPVTSIVNPGLGLMLRGDSGQTAYVITVDAGTTPSGVDLQFDGGITENASPCSLIKAGPGTLALAGVSSYTGATIVSNGTLLVNGRLDPRSGVTVLANGILGGTGTLNGPTTVQAGGALSPGAKSIGNLIVNDNLTLSGGSTVLMEASKNGGLLRSDVAFVSGTLVQNGTLVVTHLGPDPLAPGDNVLLFGAGTFRGGFTNLILPALPAGLVWLTNSLADEGALTVGVRTSSLNYLAGPNGTLSGVVRQTVNYAGSGSTVTAVPDTGYRFTRWSDGLIANPRTDTHVTNDLTVTANFEPVAAAQPVITNAAKAPNGTAFTLTGQGVAGLSYVLLIASNLPPVAWQPVRTNTADNSGVFHFTDLGATNAQRFYRVRSSP